MTTQAIYQMLAATVQADPVVRKQGESALSDCSSQSGFLSSLLQITLVPESDHAVQQAGAIYFKNKVSRSWETSSETQIALEDKTWVKQHIISAISSTNALIRAQLLTALSIILESDFRFGVWPELLPTVKSMLAMDQPQNVIYSGLLIFLELVKAFQWVSPNARAPLHPVIADMFPILLATAINIKPHLTTSIEATTMAKTIIKIYNCSIRLEICEAQQDLESLIPWGSLFVDIIELQLPAGALSMPEDKDERQKHSWWKLKKWAYQCLNTLFGRYGSAKPEKRYAAFSKMFAVNFAPKILECFLRQIQLLVQGMWMSDRAKQHLAAFLEHCVKRKATWSILKDHLPMIVTHFIFPLMCFSPQDEELWQDNPVDYIHKKVDPPMDDFKSPVVAAAQLLVAICQDRFKQAFVSVVTIINEILAQYDATPAESRNPCHKYGILNMMACLVEEALNERSPIRGGMETFLITHVVPETTSTFPFLRARACDTLLKFSSEMEYEDPNHLEYTFKHILACLKDPELPVRVEASLALSPFFRYPQIHEAMKPHAVEIMQGLMELTNEIDMDTLTHVMDQLVFEYSEQLAPFAVQLATQLCSTFMRIMSDTNFTNEDDFDLDEAEDKTMAAMGVLKTISSLILSVEGSPVILAEVDKVISPAVVFVLENCILDLYEEIFEIIETATFCSKSISETLWKLFPLIYKTFQSDAFDYFQEISPSLHNYVIYGKEVLVQSKEHRNMIFDIAWRIFHGGSGVGESDRVRACQLLEIMMLHLREHMDEFIPKCLEVAYGTLSPQPTKSDVKPALKYAKTPALRVHAIEIVANALFYNPKLALGLLEQSGWTSTFFELWFHNLEHFTRVHDKRLTILALSAILNFICNDTMCPPSMQTTWIHLFKGMLKGFEGFSKALEDRTREQRVADGEEKGDDDDEVEVEDEGNYLNDDVSDDEDDLETLARNAAEYRTTTHSGEKGEDDVADDESDDNWSVDGMMMEDVYFTTYLDEVNVFVQFEALMTRLVQTGRAAILDTELTAEQKEQVRSILSTASVTGSKSTVAEAAASQ
ncbi:Nonsense-mediated mRNA decay protein 5 [Batrachochytrium dendrobatidis]|nr:Nonsense-mediated mRNA decay protein 5 [Batrachochytrium dendrobatidis]